MISYKDRTFCASDCTQTRCFRYFGDEERAGAKLWWGSDDAPVAFSDFSPICEDYRPPQ
jgi:hypothetical protein